MPRLSQRWPRRRLVAGALAALALSLAAAPPPACALTTGVNETGLSLLPPAEQPAAVAHLRGAGLRLVRIPVQWSTIAPTRPPSRAVARTPTWDGYDFAQLDATVRLAFAAGAEPILYLEHAPPWAEGPGRPPGPAVGAGVWKPSATGLHDVAQAVAARYDGRHAPLGAAAPLPRVRYFQIWNEPNITMFLAPQLERGRVTSIQRYRELLNAGYAGVKAAQPTARVLAASLAPFGDYPARDPLGRVPPARFARGLLCSGARIGSRACPQPARFDILAFNTWPAGSPEQPPAQVDDLTVGVADARLGTPLRAAVRRRTVLPARPQPLWLTETAWATRGPDWGQIVSPALQATYLARTLYEAWRSRIDVVLWWRWRDGPGTTIGFQIFGGLYRRGPTVAQDVPKPALQAMRFPLVVPAGAARPFAWGRAPVAGTVRLERRAGGRWLAVGTRPVRAGGVFTLPLPRGTSGTLRARVGADTSVAVTLGAQGARR
jgi:hypothetical protein